MSTKCYELVTPSEIRSAQYSVAAEVEPQIKQLIALAEDGMAGLRSRDEGLANKVSHSILMHLEFHANVSRRTGEEIASEAG